MLNEQLVLAAKEGDAKKVASLLEQVRTRTTRGTTDGCVGDRWAAKFGHIECV